MSRPLKMILPLVGSVSLMSVRDSVVFPQPDSPTRPSVSPALHREVDAVHRVDLADGALEKSGLDREVLDEVLDAEDLLAERGALWIFASAPSAAAVRCRFSLRRPCAHAHCSLRVLRLVADELVGEVARGGMLGASSTVTSGGTFGAALLPPLREEATRMERAARRDVDERRRRTGDRLEPLLVLGELRQAVHEPDRVRVSRLAEDRLRRRPLSTT